MEQGWSRTERRRLLQPLWNALDRTLDAHMGRGVLLAVSGGPDSRALLEAAARWPRRLDVGDLRVAAVDHGTRPESHAEAVAVVARARALGFDAVLLPVATAAGRDEASLRRARMDALVRHAGAEGLGVVVTAHHAGDLAEGALLAWLELGGDGAAMPGQGRWGSVDVVRPFLGLSREALRLALLACGATDVLEDPDAVSARARVRRERLAPLGADRADVERRLAAQARRRRDDEDALEAAAAGLLVSSAGRSDEVEVRPGPPALVRRALRAALARLVEVARWTDADVRSSSLAVESALSLLARGQSGTVHLRGATAEVTAAGVTLRIRDPALRPPRVAAVRAPTHDGPTHEGNVGAAPFRKDWDA